jgi:hypothetical protein
MALWLLLPLAMAEEAAALLAIGCGLRSTGRTFPFHRSIVSSVVAARELLVTLKPSSVFYVLTMIRAKQ